MPLYAAGRARRGVAGAIMPHTYILCVPPIPFARFRISY